MTIPNMVFNPTDGLRNTTTYPTVPTSEAALRDAVQQQSDQLQNFVNNALLPKVLDKTGDVMTGKFTLSGGAGTETQGGGSMIQITSGHAPPISGKMIIGDGSGWKFVMSKKDVGGILTDLIEFLDSGVIKSNGKNLLQAVSGGYKVQSGKTTIDASPGVAVTFPAVFATVPIVVTTCGIAGVNYDSAYNVTTTGFTLRSSFAGQGDHFWIAIGS